MSTTIEIEKKYLVKDWDMGLEIAKNSNKFTRISDAYVPNEDKHMTLRLREKLAFENGAVVAKKFCATRKTLVDKDDSTTMIEQTIDLSESEYNALIQGLEDTTVTKDRYNIEFHGHPAEFDVYSGRHASVSFVEVEFKDEAEMNEWLKCEESGIELVDVTDNENYAVGKMADPNWKE